MKDLFLACANLLEAGEDVVMITIIDREGSGPRTAGSKMLVRRDGAIVGTIGGGIFEAQATRMAQEVFQSGQAMTREFRFSGSEISGMDMVCGGRAEIFVDVLRSCCPENAAVCRAIGELTCNDLNACLITRIVTGSGSEDCVKLAFIAGNEKPVGMSLTEADREALEPACKGRFPLRVKREEASYLIEPVRLPGTVYIFGAGHVSQKLAYLTPFLDFQTVIVDDRKEYANEKRFPRADRIVVPETMENCMKDLRISRNSYLVIVTRGHAYDAAVLAQALETDAGYIGMIGSKRKRETIYNHLRRSGVQEAALARVHSPIGIDIEAETPEEIAVSIAGELIQKRAGLIDGRV
ncbi:MAG: XdhC/CoxI family protein [Spirochaetes bacterium]|nr:MAG: XdhC/CoxI family protein [Spirochaetota bacterium]